jgi:hypothetical protein
MPNDDWRFIWQILLTIVILPFGVILKDLMDSVRTLEGSLGEHKTDVAKSYATKSDLAETSKLVMSRFDRLEEKIDRLVERSK